MKYTKLSEKIGSILLNALYVVLILFVLGIMGVFIWADITINLPILSLFWIILLPTFGLCINWFIGSFFGDKYYRTGTVIRGRSVFDVVKTPKYYKRRIYVCIIEAILFVALIVRYIFLFPYSLACALIGIICSVIAIIIYFIVGMSSYEQSDPKQENNFF